MTALIMAEEAGADWEARKQHFKDLGMRQLWWSLQIADEAARSDVELYAKGRHHPEGFTVYDLRHAETTGASSAAEEERAVRVAQRAARYIELRGDIFPWRMVYLDGTDYLVRFVEKSR